MSRFRCNLDRRQRSRRKALPNPTGCHRTTTMTPRIWPHLALPIFVKEAHDTVDQFCSRNIPIIPVKNNLRPLAPNAGTG